MLSIETIYQTHNRRYITVWFIFVMFWDYQTIRNHLYTYIALDMDRLWLEQWWYRFADKRGHTVCVYMGQFRGSHIWFSLMMMQSSHIPHGLLVSGMTQNFINYIVYIGKRKAVVLGDGWWRPIPPWGMGRERE